MRKMKHYILLSLLVVMAMSQIRCASQSKQFENSAWVTNVEIKIPGQRNEVYIQNSKLIDTKMENDSRYYPYCAIRSNKALGTELTIKANSRFPVTRVDYLNYPLELNTVLYVIKMNVKSDQYPSVTSINCQVLGDRGDTYVSEDDMRNNTRGVMTLESTQ